jgi:flagellar basal-body rod modification protein FlgD
MSNAFTGGINTVPESQTNWATTTRKPNQDLDKQAFLNLLIQQLRHQDPLNPMDDRDFIAQMAQFSALEQMTNLNATFERTQAFSMIGKLIDASFICSVSGERVEIEGGLVTSVVRQGQRVYLSVPGEGGRMVDVPFDAVREVYEDFFLSQQLHEIHGQIQGQRATDLIGKFVQGFALIGDTVEYVEGRVDSVRMEGDRAILFVGSQQLSFPYDVFAAGGDKMPLIIGSENFRIGNAYGEVRKVTGVEIESNGTNHRLYLRFDNNSRVHVQKIDHVTSALTYVGKKDFTNSVITNGTVESISMIGGIPFLNVRVSEDRIIQIDFLGYIAERTGKEVETVPDLFDESPNDTTNNTTPDAKPEEENSDGDDV